MRSQAAVHQDLPHYEAVARNIWASHRQTGLAWSLDILRPFFSLCVARCLLIAPLARFSTSSFDALQPVPLTSVMIFV